MLNNRRESHADVLAEPVRSLLAAAAAPTEPGPLPGEAEALAAFRASHTAPRRPLMLVYLTSFKTAVAAAVGTGVLLTAGVGAAAAGSLPGAVQDTASELLAKVGVTVPSANEHSAGHADERGASGDAAGASDAGKTDPKGAEVSGFATTTDLKGVEKGAAISHIASDGKSHAGEHGKAVEDHGKAGQHGKAGEHGNASGSATDESGKQTKDKTGKAPVATPNDGGTDTAADASAKQGDSASTHGTGAAGQATSGQSTAGSANRP